MCQDRSGFVQKLKYVVGHLQVPDVVAVRFRLNLGDERLGDIEQAVIEALSHFLPEGAINNFVSSGKKHTDHDAKQEDHPQAQGK